MTRFVANDIWKAVAKKAKNPGRRRAAIAYVTRDLPLQLQCGDVLITDASKNAIASGQTSAPLLRALFDRGVELFSYGGLHAKLIVIDNTAIVSSANLSGHSVDGILVEAGVITDHPGTLSGALSFIEQLKNLSQKLTEKRIKNLELIRVVRNGGQPPSRSSKGGRPKVAQTSSSWIASIHEWTTGFEGGDEAEVNEGLAQATELMADPRSEACWVCYSKKSRFAQHVLSGDTVIWLWRTKPSSKRPEFVYRHSTILLSKVGKRHRWLFYEEPVHAHKQRMKWGVFKRLCGHIGLPYQIGVNIERKLPEQYSDGLHDLWGKSIAK